MVMLTERMETVEESQDWSGCDGGDLLHTELSYYSSGLLRRGVYISTPSLVGYIALTLFQGMFIPALFRMDAVIKSWKYRFF